MINILNSGNPINGTSGEDLILGNPTTTGTAVNTLNGAGGHDLIIGDIGAINVVADTLHNATTGTAFSLETNANTWTLDHNTLIANSTTVAHSTTMVSATGGEWEYFTVSVGASKTLTVDIDFGSSSPFGGAGTHVEILGTDGVTVVATLYGGGEGSGGSFGYDPFGSYTPAAAGTYYIRVKADSSGAYFTAGEAFILNVSVADHGTGLANAGGADTIGGGAGNDALYGMAGNDAITGDIGHDTLDGGDGDDTLNGGDGTDTLYSGNGTTDVLHGNANADILHAMGSGSFFGDAGNDSLIVDQTASSQLLNGGDGIDTVDFSALAAINADLSAGTSSVAGMSLLALENVIAAAGNDTVVGNSLDNVLEGRAGDDTLIGGDGGDTLNGGDDDDTLSGGEGVDYASYSEFSYNAEEELYDGVTVSLAIAGAQYTVEAGFDTLTGIEGLIGGIGNDTFTGNDEANFFRGGQGRDTLNGAGGDDTFLMRDSDGHNSLGGDEGAVIDGGEGTDTLDFSQSVLGWSIDVVNGGSNANIHSVNGGGSVASLTSVERIVGSNSADIFTMSAVLYPVEIDAGGGNDSVLVAYEGGEVSGGSGNDTIDIGLLSLDYDASIAAGGGTLVWLDAFTFDMASGVTSRAGESLTNFENTAFLDASAAIPDPILTDYTILGTAGANDIVLGAGDDTIDGRGGTDTMAGGTGNDNYFADNAGDVIIEAAGGGSDRVFASASYVLGAAAQVEILSTTNNAGTTAINLTGNGFANSIAGNNGTNTLNGGAGADTLNGLGGNDFFFVDNAADVIVEAAGGGSDRVYASVSYVLGAAAQVEILSTTNNAGTGAINLTGNGFVNSLAGNNGANVLNGGAGADTLNGFGGNDFFYVDNAGDMVVEGAGGGSDRVYASVSYALGAAAQVEILSTTNNAGVGAINLTGNGFANSIAGNNGANMLNGGAGNDTLNGFGGADTFRFTTALGAGNVDTIAGYAVADDTIQIDNSVFTGLAAGALAAGAFNTGAAAAQADDRIIYNSATGALLFDADGNGAGAAVQFATLSAGLAMTAGEFFVI